MWYLYGVVLVAGIANAIQPGQNATLAKALPYPLVAGLVVAIGTAACVLTVGLATGRLALPSYAQAAGVPWWAWFGGVLGGGVVMTQLFVAQKIGAAPFVGLLVTATIVTSILLDHFGLIGFEQHPAGAGRILGGAFMVAGVVLIAVF